MFSAHVCPTPTPTTLPPKKQQQSLTISYPSSVKIKTLSPGYGPSRLCGPPAALRALCHPLPASQPHWTSLGLQYAPLHVTVELLHILFLRLPCLSSLPSSSTWESSCSCPDLSPDICSSWKPSLVPLAWFKSPAVDFPSPMPSPLQHSHSSSFHEWALHN